MKRSGQKMIIGTLIGLAAGYITGLLTAPKSGKETREDIKRGSAAAIRGAELKLKNLYADLGDILDEAKDRINQTSAKGKKELNKLIDEAKTAQRKVRMALNAIHDGEADDPDLHEAISDAKAAKQHLINYFRNS